MNEQLEKKVRRGIKLIQSAAKIAEQHGQVLEVAYSGGKDSDIILELTRMAGVKYRAIYKNTTIDPPGTIKHAKEQGAEIIRPKKTFLELIAQNGLPTRFKRFCCTYLKEYKVLDYAIVGVKRSESRKMAEIYKEPERCRDFGKHGGVKQGITIPSWTGQTKMLTNLSRNVASSAINCITTAMAVFTQKGDLAV